MESQPEDHDNRPEPRLYLLGAGVSFPEHLTQQSIEIMSACTRIYTNLPESNLNSLPEHLRSKSKSLWPLYKENRIRADNYKDVTRAVIDAAAATPPVAWLTPGHPLIFDSVSTNLLEAGRIRGWGLRVAPAISCIDTVLADIGYDPANGLIVCEATVAVRQNLRLIPSVATLLSQPGAFGSAITHYTTKWSPNLAPLRDYLLGFFGPEHKCAFVRSCSLPDGSSEIYWIVLHDMTSVPWNALAGSTLFIPSAASTLRRVGVLSASLNVAAAG